MKTRKLTVLGLLALPAMVSAQRIIPRGGAGLIPPETVRPQNLPPQAPVVARALAYQASRWSAEGYSIISAIRVPSANGGTGSSANFGLGTHAGYRYTDHLFATIDVSASPYGGSASTQTVEVGSRFAPLGPTERIRPFVDLRVAYLRMNDNFASLDGSSSPGGSLHQFDQTGGRYSRGAGGVGGAGFEYSLTRSFSLTNEVSILRDRLTTYRVDGAPAAALDSRYWMTSFRYALGIKYSPVHTLHLMQ